MTSIFLKSRDIYFYFCETQTWLLDLPWFDNSDILEIKANTPTFFIQLD